MKPILGPKQFRDISHHISVGKDSNIKIQLAPSVASVLPRGNGFKRNQGRAQMEGLKNFVNNNFVSVVVQLLAFCPDFALSLQSEEQVSASLRRLMLSMLRKEEVNEEYLVFLNLIRSKLKVNFQVQNDALDFMLNLLLYLENFNEGLTDSITVKKMICFEFQNCKMEFNKEFSQKFIPAPNGILHAFNAEFMYSQDNSYKQEMIQNCFSCNEEEKCTVYDQLVYYPDVILFFVKNGGEDVPDVLRLGTRSWGLFAFIKKYVISEDSWYYVAYCKTGRKWVEFLDDNVRDIGSLPSISNCYIVAYKRLRSPGKKLK